MVNGDSRIDPIYQRVAETKAYKGVDIEHPQLCETGGLKMVYDTQFIGYIQSDKTLSQENAQRGWFENWTIWQCNELKSVSVAIDQKENQVFNVLVRYAP